MEKLLNVPDQDLTTGIPFCKPMLYQFACVIAWSPAFRINHIVCKNNINTQVLLLKPHIKP